MPISLPAGSGPDAAGTVDEIGDGVGGVAIGDAVLGTGSHTYAEHAVLTDWAPKPDGRSFAEAAGYPVAVSTAHCIPDLVDLTSGQTVLISGAACGGGSAAVQFALPRRLRHRDRQPGQPALPAPNGIDAALDNAGSGIIPKLIELTGDPSKVVSIADSTAGDHGAQVSANEIDRLQARRSRAPLQRRTAANPCRQDVRTRRSAGSTGQTIRTRRVIALGCAARPGDRSATPRVRLRSGVASRQATSTKASRRVHK